MVLESETGRYAVVHKAFEPIKKKYHKAWNGQLFAVFEAVGDALPSELELIRKDGMSKEGYRELWSRVVGEI